jgi:hypothetical protein
MRTRHHAARARRRSRGRFGGHRARRRPGDPGERRPRLGDARSERSHDRGSGRGRRGQGGRAARGVGARPVVTDINPEPVDAAVREHGVDAVRPDEILGLDVDILSPNAIGSVVNDASIPAIRAKVVADGANNVLAEERHGEELERRGITYAVDFVANSGGIVYDADRLRAGGLDHARATASVRRTAVAKLHDKRDILVGDHGSRLIAWNGGVPLRASVGDGFKCKRY